MEGGLINGTLQYYLKSIVNSHREIAVFPRSHFSISAVSGHILYK